MVRFWLATAVLAALLVGAAFTTSEVTKPAPWDRVRYGENGAWMRPEIELPNYEPAPRDLVTYRL